MKFMPDDDYIWEPEYKKIPGNMLNIPGLHMIGHANFNKAWEALDTHYHKCMELVVIINGSQQYIVDGRQYLLHGGKMFITHPNEIHGNGKTPQNVCEFVWFQLDLSKQNNFLGVNSDDENFLYSCLVENEERTMDIDSRDIALISDAWLGLSSQNRGEQIWGYSCLVQFICKYFCVNKGKNITEISPDIKVALKYINNSLLSDIRIADIAHQIGISESHFKAKFRLQMGITPLGYITSQKVETAKYMLKHSSLSITEIAFYLNYSSSNYFSTVFKQYTGYTPSEFRETDRFS